MAIDQLWLTIKETARQRARRKDRLSLDESTRIVESICMTEGRLSLPRDAIDYFARELVRLTQEQQQP